MSLNCLTGDCVFVFVFFFLFFLLSKLFFITSEARVFVPQMQEGFDVCRFTRTANVGGVSHSNDGADLGYSEFYLAEFALDLNFCLFSKDFLKAALFDFACLSSLRSSNI